MLTTRKTQTSLTLGLLLLFVSLTLSACYDAPMAVPGLAQPDPCDCTSGFCPPCARPTPDDPPPGP